MAEMYVTSFDGTRLYAEFISKGGDAPVVLFMHPIGFSKRYWDDQAVVAAERYSVARFDARGHGRSDAPGGEYSIDTLRKDALAVIDGLGLGTVNLVGASLGGMVGVALAAEGVARVQTLIVANSTPCIGAPEVFKAAIQNVKAEGASVLSKGYLERWTTPMFREREQRKYFQLFSEFAQNRVAGIAGCLAALRDVDLRGDLAWVEVPTLVISGADDAPSLRDGAKLMNTAIAGSRHLVIENSAHLSNIEQSEQFNRAMMAFLP